MLSVGSKLSPRLAVALARCLGPWTSFPWLASQLCAGLGLWVSALVVLLPAANTFWLAGVYAYALAAAYIPLSQALGLHVITAPSVLRPRLRRLRQRLGSVLAGVTLWPALAVLLAQAVSALAARPGVGSALASANKGLLLRQEVGLALAAGLTSVWWAIGSCIVSLILQEPLSLARDVLSGAAPGAVVDTLKQALDGARGPAVGTLAMRSLADEAGGASPTARSLTALLFADDAGGAWQAIAGPCLGAVTALSAALQPALGEPKESAARSSAAPAGWNRAQAPQAQRSPASQHSAVLRSLLAACEDGPHAVDAARALSALCCAARTADRLGVVQYAEPGLGAAVAALSRALQRSQSLQRATLSLPAGAIAVAAAAHGSWGLSASAETVDAALCPLWMVEDAARTCLGRLLEAYGPASLEQAVLESRALGPDEKQETLLALAKFQ